MSLEKRKKIEGWVAAHKWSAFLLSPTALAFFYGIFLFLYEIKFMRELIPPIHPLLIGWAGVQIIYHYLICQRVKHIPHIFPLACFALAAGATALVTFEAGILQNMKGFIMALLPLLIFYPLCLQRSIEQRKKTLLIALSGAAVVMFVSSIVALVMYLMNVSGEATFMGITETIGTTLYDANHQDSGILLYGIYEDTNHTAIYALVMAAYSAFLAFSCKKGLFIKKWVNIVGMVFGALNFAVQLIYFPLANSRGGWIALGLALFVAGFFYIRQWLKSKKGFLRSAAAFGLSLTISVALLGGLLCIRTVVAYLPDLVRFSMAETPAPAPEEPSQNEENSNQETPADPAPAPEEPSQNEEITNQEAPSDPTPQPELTPDHFDKNNGIFAGGRLGIWQEALALFAKYPIFGTGPSNNQYFAQKHFQYGTLIYGKAIHNSYLDLLVDYGVVGFLPMMAFLLMVAFAVIKQLWVKKQRGDYYLFFGCLILLSCAAMLLSCTFINTTAMYFLLLVLIGYLLADLLPEEKEREEVFTLRRILSLIRRKLVRGFMIFCRIFPIQNNKIVILNYYGNGFGDNGKGIALSLFEKEKGLDIVWAARPEVREKLPAFLRYVRFRSLKYYWESATAKVWVDNSRKGADMIKRKGQYYIQCWHGALGLKLSEKDAEDHLNVSYVEDAKNDSKMADLFISGCGFFTEKAHNIFWYDGEVLECGSPRSDALFKATEQSIREAKEYLGIPLNKKVILYAPTFRVHGGTDCYSLDFEKILNIMEERTGEEWVFAVRLHPNVAQKADFIHYGDKIYDATSFPDLYDLIPAMDMVISDYSSLMFDSALIQKPVFVFATDLPAYKADRDLYWEFSDLPFAFSENNEELLKNLKNFDQKKYEEKLAKFSERVDSFEKGTASDAVSERILEVMNVAK